MKRRGGTQDPIWKTYAEQDKKPDAEQDTKPDKKDKDLEHN